MEQETPVELAIHRVLGCARCGGSHEGVVARRMARPFAPAEAGGLIWTHWAPCPANGDPILVMVEQERSTPLGPIAMPIPGPGMPRESGGPPAWAVWLIPVGVVVVTVLAILCGALWR